MQKRILLITSVAGIAALFIAGAYYIAIFLPQKQKASMEMTKLELQAQIEQEKTEQTRIEQKKEEEEARKQADLLVEERKKEELKKEEQQKNIQNNKTARNNCLASVKKRYQDINQEIEDGFDVDLDGDITPQGMISLLDSATKARSAAFEKASTAYENAKNDCYHKYPLPNEDF